jgi:hypothetical protein
MDASRGISRRILGAPIVPPPLHIYFDYFWGHGTGRSLKRWLFAAQDIFSDNASVRFAEKSHIFRALRFPRVIRGKNMIRAQSHCRSFSATCWRWRKILRLARSIN